MKPSLFLSCVAITGVLTSCAQLTSVPLLPNGAKDTSQEEGIRYYLPRPYLLVAELPIAPAGSQDQNLDITADTPPARKETSGDTSGNSPSKNQPQAATTQQQTAAPSAAPADTSFSATMVSYSVKLIYLPDYSRPMALKMSSGLFGTVSAVPALQDGWMLTSLSGSSDSAAALTALAGLVSGTATGGAKAATTVPSSKAVPPKSSLEPKSINPENKTDLKDFSDDQLAEYGKSIGKGLSRFPLPNDLKSLTDRQASLLLMSITNGLSTRLTSAQAPTAPPPWGRNVLPPGLYAFQYSEPTASPDSGRFKGLVPILFFCKEGPTESKVDRQTTAISYREGQTMSGYETPCPHD